MYVEDILIAISNKVATVRRPFGSLFDGQWYRSFISSVAQHIQAERALSSNQSRTILKMIDKARAYIVTYGIASAVEIEHLLAAPRHRRTPYVSAQVPREVRYIGDNLLALRCKADGLLTAHIKALGNPPITSETLMPTRPRFDWTHRIWIVPVHHFNLPAIRDLLHEHRFHTNRATADYLDLCAASINQPSICTFTDTTRSIMIVNICDDYIMAGWITNVAGGIVL
jgi:hypothetical protein